MHAVGDHTVDIVDKFRLGLITQVAQHLAVDKIEGKAVLYVAAHHTSGQRIVQQLLALADRVLDHQRLGIVFVSLLAVARLRKMQAGDLPHALRLFNQGKETSKTPHIYRVLQHNLKGKADDVLPDRLLVNHGEIQAKGLRNLQNILPEIRGHRLFSSGGFVLPGPHKGDVLRQILHCLFPVPLLKPNPAELPYCLNRCHLSPHPAHFLHKLQPPLLFFFAWYNA